MNIWIIWYKVRSFTSYKLSSRRNESNSWCLTVDCYILTHITRHINIRVVLHYHECKSNEQIYHLYLVNSICIQLHIMDSFKEYFPDYWPERAGKCH